MQVPDSDYRWWEIAAGGISCLAIHALFALAAQPTSSSKQAALLDAAYFPPICAISALLDSLADHDGDASTDNHSFTAHYRDDTYAAERLAAINVNATIAIRELGQHQIHHIILSGIVAFYLSSPSVETGFSAPVAEKLISVSDSRARLMRAVMRMRRWAHTSAAE